MHSITLSALKKAISFHKVGAFYPSSYGISTPRKDDTWQAFLQEVQDVACMIGAVESLPRVDVLQQSHWMKVMLLTVRSIGNSDFSVIYIGFQQVES